MRYISLLLGSLLFLLNSNAQNIDSATLLKDLKILSSDAFEGRAPGTKGHRLANEYITRRFKKLNLKSFSRGHQQDFIIKDSLHGQNIIGYLPGKLDSCIVISAHYDHEGIRNGKTFNGADDNASGTAALLAFARYFKKQKKKPYYTIVFAAFDAEEKGLLGAKAFNRQPPLPLSKVILNINMDMISRNDKNELYACGIYHYPFLQSYIVGSNPVVQLKTGHDLPETGSNDWTFQSDHGAFHKNKIPFIYFGVEDHPDYHTPNDKFEHIQPGFYYNASQVILKIARSLAYAPLRR